MMGLLVGLLFSRTALDQVEEGGRGRGKGEGGLVRRPPASQCGPWGPGEGVGLAQGGAMG